MKHKHKKCKSLIEKKYILSSLWNNKQMQNKVLGTNINLYQISSFVLI